VVASIFVPEFDATLKDLVLLRALDFDIVLFNLRMIKVFNFGFYALTVLNLKSKVLLVFPEARCKVKHRMNLCQAQIYSNFIGAFLSLVLLHNDLFTYIGATFLWDILLQVM